MLCATKHKLKFRKSRKPLARAVSRLQCLSSKGAAGFLFINLGSADTRLDIAKLAWSA